MAGGSKTTRSEPWTEQKPYLQAGFRRAGELYEAAPRGAAYYGGPTVAGFDPAQQASQRSVLNYALGSRPQEMQKAAEANVNQMQTGMVDTASFNPMMSALGDQMKTQLEGKVLPGIRQSMVEYQPGGGSRGDIIQANAISSANQQMLNKAAEMYTGAYGQAQQQRAQAAQMYPGMMQAPLGMAEAVGGVGAERQAMTQTGIDRDIARYEYESRAPQTALQNYMAAISGDYGGTSTAPGPSALAQMGQVAGIIGALSDARLKRNIEKLDLNDVNLYRFNYVDDEKTHIGVMAQEHEDKVVGDIDGYKVVNYAEFIPMMMHSIQALTAKVEDLQKRLDN